MNYVTPLDFLNWPRHFRMVFRACFHRCISSSYIHMGTITKNGRQMMSHLLKATLAVGGCCWPLVRQIQMWPAATLHTGLMMSHFAPHLLHLTSVYLEDICATPAGLHTSLMIDGMPRVLWRPLFFSFGATLGNKPTFKMTRYLKKEILENGRPFATFRNDLICNKQ